MTALIWRAECALVEARLWCNWRNALRWTIGLRKVGGLWHWRIGRIGGSFYIRQR